MCSVETCSLISAFAPSSVPSNTDFWPLRLRDGSATSCDRPQLAEGGPGSKGASWALPPGPPSLAFPIPQARTLFSIAELKLLVPLLHQLGKECETGSVRLQVQFLDESGNDGLILSVNYMLLNLMDMF